MRKLSIAAFALVFAAASAAYADEKPTDDEAAKIKAAVAEWGCDGGTYEKEAEGTGVFEAEDVKCKAGQYDFRLDKDFKVFVITKD
jgi:predicted outer membrane protein